MKPAPFENVDHTDPMTKYRVKSVLKTGEGEEGTTEVLSPQGKSVWKMDEFIGNWQPHVSGDGKYLVLTGTFYFPETLKVAEDAEMAKIYKSGKLINKITMGQLLEGDPIELTSGLKVMGGNWVDQVEVIKSMKIDWKAQTITFKLFNKKTKTFHFVEK